MSTLRIGPLPSGGQARCASGSLKQDRPGTQLTSRRRATADSSAVRIEQMPLEQKPQKTRHRPITTYGPSFKLLGALARHPLSPHGAIRHGGVLSRAPGRIDWLWENAAVAAVIAMVQSIGFAKPHSRAGDKTVNGQFERPRRYLRRRPRDRHRYIEHTPTLSDSDLAHNGPISDRRAISEGGR